MKKYIPILFLLYSVGLSQQYEDVVYLKDGSVIRGLIIEQVPNKSIKIKSGKNIFVYQMDEIEKLAKELNEDVETSLEDKTLSLQVGLGNHRNYSLLGISKDIKFSESFGLYLTASIGTPMLAMGVYIQNNYNDNGFNLAAALGFGPFGEAVNGVINYQWRSGKSGFVSFGLALGVFTDEYWRRTNSGGYYTTIRIPYLIPVIGYDKRF